MRSEIALSTVMWVALLSGSPILADQFPFRGERDVSRSESINRGRDQRADPEIPSIRPKGAGQPHCGPWVKGIYESIQVNVDIDGCNIVGGAAHQPSIAVDPTNPRNIVLGWRHVDDLERESRQAAWGYSHDGGHSWNAPGLLEDGIFRIDPVLEADTDGNIYYLSMRSSYESDVFKSSDGGISWQAPVPVVGGKKPWMAIDRTSGIGRNNIYTFSDDTEFLARSTTRGATFGISDRIPGDLYQSTITVGPNGAVYIAGPAHDSEGGVVSKIVRSLNARDESSDPTFESLNAITLCPAAYAATSAPTELGKGSEKSPNPQGWLQRAWVDADHSGGPTHGNIYVMDRATCWGDDQLMFARSEDDGITWSQPVRVNDDPLGGSATQWLGMMSVAPNGRIDVVWNDTRNSGVSNLSELFYAYSTDAGATWSENVPVSPMFDSYVGWWYLKNLGNHYDMVSDDLGVNVAYAATFNGEQDIYFLRIGAYDCNDNGIPDVDDIMDQSSEDCNANNVPDECERDCNGTGVPDACDIANGWSVDDDGSGVPDECENLILYVDVDATGANDGLDWTNAFNDLQEALAAVTDARGGVKEVWVAGGTYKPDRGTGRSSATFKLPPGVAIYGGFAGGETDLAQRDLENSISVLDGDLLSNDGSIEDGRSGSDCCDRRETSGCDDDDCEASVCALRPSCCTTQWDSFCSLLADLQCCDLCSYWGSQCDNSDPVVMIGPGDPAPVLDGFTIRAGFAVRNRPGISHGFEGRGGGLFINQSQPRIANCRFEDNFARHEGGAIASLNSTLTLEDCQFEDNHANSFGAAMYLEGGVTELSRCLFANNGAERYVNSVIDNYMTTELVIDECSFIDNSVPGSVIHTYLSNTTITNSLFVDNQYAVNQSLGSLVVTNTRFLHNDRGIGFGGDGAVLTNSTFIGSRYGAIDLGRGEITINNCVVNGNSSVRNAGGIQNRGANLSLTNSTVVNNTSEANGGGLFSGSDASTTIVNSILWGNRDSSGDGETAQVFQQDLPGSLNVDYNVLQGWTGDLGGDGNLDSDPMFVDPLGLDGLAGTQDDDLSIADGSPCIDAGDSDAVPSDTADLDSDLDVVEPTPLDLAGNPRMVDDLGTDDSGHGMRPIVDIGAYEFTIDCNANGVDDQVDIATHVSNDCNLNGAPDECEADCNGNLVVDECDIDDQISNDCTGNKIPDECEVDCNSNGDADSCDILDNISTDCDDNRIPDECDLDCNENGIPDTCDLADDPFQDLNHNGILDVCDVDCNENGIPDDLDILWGLSEDTNSDGVPDECGLQCDVDGDEDVDLDDWAILVGCLTDPDGYTPTPCLSADVDGDFDVDLGDAAMCQVEMTAGD